MRPNNFNQFSTIDVFAMADTADAILSNISRDNLSTTRGEGMIGQFKDGLINTPENRTVKFFKVSISARNKQNPISTSTIRQARASYGLSDKGSPYLSDMPYDPGVRLSSGGEKLTQKENLPIPPNPEESLSALIRYVPVSLISSVSVLQSPLLSTSRQKSITGRMISQVLLNCSMHNLSNSKPASLDSLASNGARIGTGFSYRISLIVFAKNNFTFHVQRKM
jgi:hypothetical protein